MVIERLSRYWMLVLLIVAAMSVSGCAAIAGIFKAGMWTGVVMVVILIAIVGFIATRIRG
jgi:hypothetical protein